MYELHGLLLIREMNLESQIAGESLTKKPSSTPFTSKQNNQNSQSLRRAQSQYPRGRGKGRGGHSNPPKNNFETPYIRPPCQICNNTGQWTIHRRDYSYQGQQPPVKLAAMVTVGYETWCTNTGATNHVISNLENLSIHSSYQGGDRVFVGNGTSLEIKNHGSSILKQNRYTFQ